MSEGIDSTPRFNEGLSVRPDNVKASINASNRLVVHCGVGEREGGQIIAVRDLYTVIS